MLTETVRVAGVFPLVGDTESQGAVAGTEAVKATADGAVSCTVCAGAAIVDPMTELKFRVAGETVRPTAAVTFNITGISSGLPAAPVEVTVTLPVYCPGASDPLLTETWTLAGVVPLAGVAVSQLPRLLLV